MMTKNHRGARSLNEITGNVTDAELDYVTGGDKATTTKDTTKTTTTTTKPMVFTLEQVLVSSY
jgi:hypothetical protein